MQFDVLNSKGEKTGRSIELPDEVFAIQPNDHTIYLSVKQFLANQRQGTHKTKTRAEVHGSSKKLHKQKGTGGARKGNIRNPLYKGGGTINGPLPHAYGFKLNKNVKDLARKSALSYKAQSGNIVIIEDLKMDAPKTKDFANMLLNVAPNARRTMVILPEHDNNVYLSGRNIASNKTEILTDVNTYDLMNASTLVFTEGAIKRFSEEDTAEVA